MPHEFGRRMLEIASTLVTGPKSSTDRRRRYSLAVTSQTLPLPISTPLEIRDYARTCDRYIAKLDAELARIWQPMGVLGRRCHIGQHHRECLLLRALVVTQS